MNFFVLQDAIELLRSPEKKAAFVMGKEVALSPHKYAADCQKNAKAPSLLERVNIFAIFFECLLEAWRLIFRSN